VTRHADDPLGQLREEMKVVGQLKAVETRRLRRRTRAAIALVNQDQVQVAVVAQLAAAELAETQEHEPTRLTRPRPLRQERHPEALGQSRVLQRGNLNEDRFGQVAEIVRGLLNGDLAQDVANPNAE